MDPETAFWLLSTTAQAAAALAGRGIVAWVFALRRTREDLLAARRAGAKVGRALVVRGVKSARPLAWGARLHLVSVAMSLFFLSTVQTGLPTPWSVDAGAYIALGLLIAGNAGLVLFLRDPWRFLRDQVEVTDSRPLEFHLSGPEEPGEEEGA